MKDRCKLAVIQFLDWLDDRILGHRWYWLCGKVALSSWWGPDHWVE